MMRGLLLVLIATPVCAAVSTMVGVGVVDILITGEPFDAGEAASGAVFTLGPLVVVGLAIYFTRRSEQRRPLMAVLLTVGALIGGAAGAAFGWDIVEEKHEEMRHHIATACGWVTPAPIDCEERARLCIYEVDEEEITVERGIHFGEAAEQAAEGGPTEPRDHAIYLCLTR